MEHEELMPVIRLAIQQELPAIVDAVLKRMEELKKTKEDEFWKTLCTEERERLTGA